MIIFYFRTFYNFTLFDRTDFLRYIVGNHHSLRKRTETKLVKLHAQTHKVPTQSRFLRKASPRAKPILLSN